MNDIDITSRATCLYRVRLLQHGQVRNLDRLPCVVHNVVGFQTVIAINKIGVHRLVVDDFLIIVWFEKSLKQMSISFPLAIV